MENCQFGPGVSLLAEGLTQSNDESQYPHGGGQLTGAVAVVDDANLLLLLAIVSPALTDDGTEYYDRKYLQTIISNIKTALNGRNKLTTDVSLRMTVGFLIKAMIFSMGPKSDKCLSNCSISGNC